MNFPKTLTAITAGVITFFIWKSTILNTEKKTSLTAVEIKVHQPHVALKAVEQNILNSLTTTPSNENSHSKHDEIQNSEKDIEQQHWSESFPSLNTYSWIFSRLGGNPQEKERLRKYEQDPYDGLLDKLVNLKPDKMITISKGTTFQKIKNVISDHSFQLFAFRNSQIISKVEFSATLDEPICVLSMQPNPAGMRNLDTVHFFVDKVIRPFEGYPGFVGLRLVVISFLCKTKEI